MSEDKFSIATTECYMEDWAQMYYKRGRSGGPEDVPGKREMSSKMVGTFEIFSTLSCLLLQFQVLTAFLFHPHAWVGSSCLLVCVHLSLAPTHGRGMCHIFLSIIKYSLHWSAVSVIVKLDCLATNSVCHLTFSRNKDRLYVCLCHPTSLIISLNTEQWEQSMLWCDCGTLLLGPKWVFLLAFWEFLWFLIVQLDLLFL